MEESALTKTVRSIKSESAIAALVFLSISIAAYLIYTFILREPDPKPTNIPYQENVYPGVTTKKQVESRLGEPEEKTTKEEAEVYLYPTQSKYREINVEFSNDIVSFVKQEFVGTEETKLPDYFNRYGTQEAILYDEDHEFSPGYFWGSKGFIVFGSKYDGGINEIWYFPSMTKEEFLADHPEFSEEEKKHIEQFTQP